MTNKGLQIGNYIKRNGLVVRVDEQTFWDIKNFPEQYEYIELTEEWLLRLGFERVGIFAEFRKKKYHIRICCRKWTTMAVDYKWHLYRSYFKARS